MGYACRPKRFRQQPANDKRIPMENIHTKYKKNISELNKKITKPIWFNVQLNSRNISWFFELSNQNKKTHSPVKTLLIRRRSIQFWFSENTDCDQNSY